MIFNKVNESYDGVEVVVEGWLRSCGICLAAVGSIGAVASPLLLPFGLNVAGTALITSAGIGTAGIGALYINNKLDESKLKKLFSKSPAITKYLDNFYKSYKKKHPKNTYFHESDIPKNYLFDDVKTKSPVRVRQYAVQMNMGDYNLIVLCDDQLKTISAMFLVVYKTYEAPDKLSDAGYYKKYERIPAPSVKDLEKAGLKLKK